MKKYGVTDSNNNIILDYEYDSINIIDNKYAIVGIEHTSIDYGTTTEEIWQSRPWNSSNESIHKAPFPMASEFDSIQGNAAVYDAAVALINLIRKEKAEQKRSVKTPVLEMVVSTPKNSLEVQALSKEDIINAANIKENNISFVEGETLALTTCIFGEDEKKVKA